MANGKADVTENVQPVRFIEGDQPAKPKPGMALCLSGGGYRAMLFHVGALMRLNQMGLLRTVVRVSSVSGGSIAAAMLGLIWKKLEFDTNSNAGNLDKLQSRRRIGNHCSARRPCRTCPPIRKARDL